MVTAITIIEPPRGVLASGLTELWQARRLLLAFAWRDIKVRYKQTVLGASWALVQPVLSMVVLTLVFGRLVKVSSGGVAYPVFVLCGVLPWQFFAQGLVRSSNSLVRERSLLNKVYLPRLILPVAAILTGLPDFAAAFAVLLGILFYYGVALTHTVVLVIPFLLLAGATALCAGLFLSALNVRYRDVGHTIPFFTQLWFFLTPVAYQSSLVPDQWRFVYRLNPMMGVVEGFRRAMLAKPGVSLHLIAFEAAIISVLLLLGLLWFQRLERTFADLV